MTTNLTSWATMRFWVETLRDDVVLLQETRVPPAGLAAARAQARDASWAGVRQAAVQGAAGGPASGGLAVLVREGRRIVQVPTTGHHPARWLHAVVEAELGKPLHVVTLYGHDAGQPDAPERKVELFQDVFSAMAELGAAQWVIGGDWNEEAAAIWELVAAGHRGPLLPRGAAEVPRGTCAVGGRRIDFFAATPVLVGSVSVEEVLEEPTLHPHRPVRLGVAAGGRPAQIPGLDTPEPFLAPDKPRPGGPQPSGVGAWTGRAGRWRDLLRAADVEGLWQEWCQEAEGWLQGWAGLTDRRFLGRGRAKRVRLRPGGAVRPGRHG